MSNVEDELRSRVVAFVAELSTLVRRAALEAVQAQLAGEAPAPRVPAPKATAAPKAAPAAKLTPAARTPSKPAATKRRPGQKRDPGELAKLVERLADHIKANPGQRMEQIIPALGVPRRDLALPIQKLLHANRITSKGEKRGTVYAPV